MARPELTQQELQAHLDAGKSMIWQYKTLLEIKTHKTGRHYMAEVGRKPSPRHTVGVTPPGRHTAMIPREAMYYLHYDQLQESEVKAWYQSEYPSDDMGADINPDLTFADLYRWMAMYRCAYGALHVADSVIRERVFGRLASLLAVAYDDIYDLWMEPVRRKHQREAI